MMISVPNLKNFKTGSLLLTGLFLYDVFWVYFSGYFFTGDDRKSVMEHVAVKSTRNPVYVLAQVIGMPKSRRFIETLQLPNKLVWDHSILGLGDIVLPGLLLAFLKRFDAVRGKGYWKTGLAGYLLGLTAAVAMGFWTESGQPALLYIVPATIGLVVLHSLARGEFDELWNTELRCSKYRANESTENIKTLKD